MLLHTISRISTRRLAVQCRHGVSTSASRRCPQPKLQRAVDEGGGGGSQSASNNTRTSSSTVLSSEVKMFEDMSSSWWSQSGEFKALHSMNRLRVPFIRDGFLNNEQIQDSNVELPLLGLKVLDVGCGGGILSLPLGRLGAEVTGLDPGKENVRIATSELQSAGAMSPQLLDRMEFVCSPLEDFVPDHMEEFDGVVISEVLEHVADPAQFLQLASEVLKPGGSLFVTTINRTHLSWLGAIVAGEYLLRILPVGTHSWKQFVAPEELQVLLNRTGLSTRLIHGMAYHVWSDSWSWSRCTDINYALHAVKLN